MRPSAPSHQRCAFGSVTPEGRLWPRCAKTAPLAPLRQNCAVGAMRAHARPPGRTQAFCFARARSQSGAIRSGSRHPVGSSRPCRCARGLACPCKCRFRRMPGLPHVGAAPAGCASAHQPSAPRGRNDNGRQGHPHRPLTGSRIRSRRSGIIINPDRAGQAFRPITAWSGCRSPRRSCSGSAPARRRSRPMRHSAALSAASACRCSPTIRLCCSGRGSAHRACRRGSAPRKGSA